MKAFAFPVDVKDSATTTLHPNGSSFGSGVSRDVVLSPGLQNHQPLTVLFVSHDAHPNGAQKLLLTLTSWLKENEFVNPRFVLAGPGALTEEFLKIGPVLSWDADKQGDSGTDKALRLLRSFCGNDLSAVYLNSAASGHLIDFTRHLNVSQIVHVHELEKSIERWVGPKRMSALRSYADLFIAASAPVADNLHERHGISKDRLRVVDSFIRSTAIPNISDSEKSTYKSALGLNPDAKVVLGCGTTDWRKGPDLFVQVANAVRQRNAELVQFIWVGGEGNQGEINALGHLDQSGGVQIRFIGAVSNPLPFMIAADVFILTSREDPFPLVCLESADCGVPIICFAEAGGMPNFVGSTCGAVVSYLDVQGMADQLCAFLSDETKTRQLGAQASEKVRSQFDVSVKGKDIYEILRSLCGAPKRNRIAHV